MSHCTHNHHLLGCPHHAPALQRPVARRGFLKGAATAGLLAGASSWLQGCATNPATGESTFAMGSLEDDIALGRQEHPKIVQAFGGEYEDKRLASYVTQLGQNLARRTELPNLPYKFTILNSPVVNAMALPGGFVYVTRGLLALASNEAEIAGVVGHEIGHVVARHTAQRQADATLATIGLIILGVATGSPELAQLGQIGAVGLLQSHSREQELEADMLGVRYMSRNGHDPDGMVSFLASLREYSQLEARLSGEDPSIVDEYNWLATHPRTLDRVQLAMEKANEAAPANPILNREGYLAQIDGMLYGDDPRQGIIDGQRFRHPDLRFEFTAPVGFRLFNSADNVSARHPNGGQFVFDMASSNSNDMAEYLVYDWASDVSLSDVERIDINGQAAATGWTRVNSRGGQLDLRALVIEGDNDNIFRFLFANPSGQRGWAGGFQETSYSFRRLTANEAAKIKAFRLLVVPTDSGESVQALARSMPFGEFNDQAFRVLNDLAPNEGLPGGPMKIVTS